MYLVDTNILIDAKNSYYGFAICPGFWQWVLDMHNQKKLYSIKSVRDEINKGEDDLTKWVTDQLPPSFWIGRNEETAPHLSDIATWCASSERYTHAAQAEFYQAADYYLVAQARQLGWDIVTAEIPSESKKKVKIPEAAAFAGVSIVPIFDLLHQEGATFN